MLPRYHLKRKNITVIRARIDMSIYKPMSVSRSFMKKYHLPESGKNIVMAIRLAHPKQPWIDNLLSFAGQMNTQNTPVNILIAGDGPLRTQLAEQVSAINHQLGATRVSLLGPIPDVEQMTQLV